MDMDENERIKKELFRKSMKGEWKEVVKIYRANPRVHKAKITRSGDTALHIAVSDKQEDIVKQLVRIIIDQGVAKEVLNIKNERGNTSLHLAASIGSVLMCDLIAKIDPSLVGARNDDNETPFFLAALNGKKEGFLSLHKICKDNGDKGYDYCRRKDGETILHCAIAGDYFDLAFQIIRLYDKLVKSVNEQGFSPLHLLASKPSAFRSGSHFAGCYKIIYHCIFVDELKPSTDQQSTVETSTLNDKKNTKYPENYRTCVDFFKLFQVGLSSLQCKKEADAENPQGTNGAQAHELLPANYNTFFEIVKLASKTMLVILGLGSVRIKKIQDKKEKHTWAVQIMNELLERTSDQYEYENNGTNPRQATSPTDSETHPLDVFDEEHNHASITKSLETNREDKNKERKGKDKDVKGDSVDIFLTKLLACRNGNDWLEKVQNHLAEQKVPERAKKETPILIAAKNGVTEMVAKILELFPVAIHDMNTDKKNIVLLAVENRQPHVYQLLLERNILTDSVFRKVDSKGNSALHLAAMLGDYKPWLIPGAALQMQWEIRWYEFVKNSMPLHFFPHYNKEGKTSKDIFTETHKELVQNGGEWLTNTSESCSVVAALIATVAFATSSTVPGGVKEGIGTPTLENEPPFDVFAVSSLVALCSSVTSVVMFLAILTSRYQERDFGQDLPRKLLLGLTSLFVSISAILISFCAGHFFVLKDKLKYAAFPVYAVTCLPVTFFAIAQFPLYFDLTWATFKKVPQRSYKVVN